MSDLRYDPVFGQWSCIAESRQTRPFEFQQFTQRRVAIDCPFCKGNESVTPSPIVEWMSDGVPMDRDGEWLIRVLPNKYPAMNQHLAIADQAPEGIQRAAAEGWQEVLVASPRHVVSLSGLDNDELFASFSVFQSRLKHHLEARTASHICFFMNCRPLAGASIEHAHFQLIGSPICTPQVTARIQRMNDRDGCQSENTVWEEMLKKEIDSQERVIEVTSDFLVFCPFASRYSNQIRIAPLGNMAFVDLSSEQRQGLALLCRKWIDGIERCLEDPAYNLIAHLPPADCQDSPWFFDLVPRSPQAAGFELATECWVNPVSPETAAQRFRKFEAR